MTTPTIRIDYLDGERRHLVLPSAGGSIAFYAADVLRMVSISEQTTQVKFTDGIAHHINLPFERVYDAVYGEPAFKLALDSSTLAVGQAAEPVSDDDITTVFQSEIRTTTAWDPFFRALCNRSEQHVFLDIAGTPEHFTITHVGTAEKFVKEQRELRGSKEHGHG